MNELEAWRVIAKWLAQNRDDFARLGSTGTTLFVEMNDDVHAVENTAIELATRLRAELHQESESQHEGPPTCCDVPMVVASVSFKGISYRCNRCGSSKRFDDDA